MSSEDRGFSSTETATFVGFAVVGLLLGIGAYQIGGKMAGSQGGAVITPAGNAANTPNGEALFAANCAGCHGAQAKGGVGPALAAVNTWTDDQFKEAVLNGKSPTRELTAVMPRFGTVGFAGQPVTDDQLKTIHSYIQNIK